MITDLRRSRIKILIMGEQKWKNAFIGKQICDQKKYQIQFLCDSKKSMERLQHNSYDVLILQDGFLGKDAVKYATMAYAMAKPTVVVCKNVLKRLKYFLSFNFFSKFTKKYETSKKFITFSSGIFQNGGLVNQLSKYHEKYSRKVDKQIQRNFQKK